MYCPFLHKTETSIFSQLLFMFIMQRDLLQEAAYIFQHQIDNDTEQ